MTRPLPTHRIVTMSSARRRIVRERSRLPWWWWLLTAVAVAFILWFGGVLP